MSGNNLATNRLVREYKRIDTKPVENLIIVPDPKNIFEWHFVIHDLEDSLYSGGYYHGKILFPAVYPNEPPKILFITPSGRFQTNTALCLSYTNYHPENWTPFWTVETMLVGLISFMNTNEPGIGYFEASNETRKQYAKMSLKFNFNNPEFIRIFEPKLEALGIQKPQPQLVQPKPVSQAQPQIKSEIIGDKPNDDKQVLLKKEAENNKNKPKKTLWMRLCKTLCNVD